MSPTTSTEQVDQGVARKAQKRDGRSENGSSVGSAVSVPPANIAGISSERGRRTSQPRVGGFLSAVRPPAWPVAFPRQGIGTMLLIGSPLAWTGTHSSLARGDHAHRLRSGLDAPLGVRARGHRPTPQRAGTLLGFVLASTLLSGSALADTVRHPSVPERFWGTWAPRTCVAMTSPSSSCQQKVT